MESKAKYQREWRARHGIETLGAIGETIPCRSCQIPIVRTGSKKIFCKPCALSRKRAASRAYQKRQNLGVIGSTSSCECGKPFIKNSGKHRFCNLCSRINARKISSALSKKRYHENIDDFRKYNREWMRKRNEEIKLQVLTHYGKDKKLQCAWENCQICDIDMLSLDHVNDNGYEERKSGLKSGQHTYKRLIRSGFPEGFQTLCYNHQFKKALAKKRRERL